MRASSLILPLVSAAALVACSYAGTPVPLRGSAVDISRLAGRWDGEFWSDESGRRGTLLFTIRAGNDTALGDVVLYSGMTEPVIAADAKDPQHLRHSRAPEVLHVSFVAVQGEMLRGEIEPYIAPDCNCVVVTEFLGAIAGDSVQGRYDTRGPGVRQTGRWSMRRIGSAQER